MLNHLFYQNPITFGDYILNLKKIASSDDFIAINYRFLPKSLSIAMNHTINRPQNRDKIDNFEPILMKWINILERVKSQI
jgi:hypothetical protein